MFRSLFTLVLLEAALLLSSGSTAAATPVDPRANAPRVLPSKPGGDVPMATDDDRVRPSLPGVSAKNLSDPRDGVRRRGSVDSLDSPTPELTAQQQQWVERAAKTGPIAEVGGDDVVVQSSTQIRSERMAIASNGDIYVALGYLNSADFDEWIQVYRSTDGGDSFSLFGTINRAGASTERLWGLHIAEGVVDRVFVLYQDEISPLGGFAMKVAYEDLSSSTAAWTTSIVFDQSGVSFLHPDITSDASSYSGYYMYAVSSGLDYDGDDIWYSRSTDYGATWSAPYRIATLTASSNLMYAYPQISYGIGGVLHVSFTYTERLQDTFDDALRYRRALNFGASASDWQPELWSITSEYNGIDEVNLDSAASTVGNTYVFTFSYNNYYLPYAWFSDDAGASWSYANVLSLPFDAQADVLYRSSTSEFVFTGEYYTAANQFQALCRSPEASPLSFTTPVQIGDETWGYRPSVALDATHGDRIAVGWTSGNNGYFDAEWRGDPGYPNLEPGFPMALSAKPMTPPAVVDVDGDSYQEIVYGDQAGDVWVVHHDGTVATGWPQNVGSIPYRAPIAVGDLNGDGKPAIVVGTTTGQVYAFAPDGSLLEGWPVDLGRSANTFVSIGALGPPYPHWVVACCGKEIYTLNYRGVQGRTHPTFTGPLIAPAAFGDVDADGVTEMVVLMGPGEGTGWYGMYVANNTDYNFENFWLFYSNQPDGAATLADLDLNGDLEIVVPTAEGLVFAFHYDMSAVSGFPFDAGGGFPVTEVAMANILGTGEPELAFASLDYRLHVVYASGTEHSAYPKPTGTGWYLIGAPILDTVNASSANPIIGSRDSKAWTYRNIGLSVPGWPKSLGGQCELSPASGDIDKDGHNEIVFLTFTDLVVVDVGYPQQSLAGWRWPMYGYDPQRTGCLNCSEDLVTAVDDAPTVTRISFAAPSPNPASGRVLFRYVLPAPAVVELQIIDVRGRRVSTVLKQEQSSGEHLIGFDGRDHNGIALADGQYFARLQVRGPQASQTLTRKFSLLR